MNEPHAIRNDFAAYLSGDLDEAAAGRVRSHLESCPACSRELASLRSLWRSLGGIPEETPSPALADRFYRALGAAGSGRPDGAPETGARRTAGGSQRSGRRGAGLAAALDLLLPSRPVLQFSLVFAVMVTGALVGYTLRGNGARNEEIGQLRDEVRSVSRLLIVSLLQQQSAVERLQGVRWTYKVDGSDPEITGALLQTFNQDPNVNVRLAALDALAASVHRSEVREELLRTLGRESSPMIQLAIIDLAVRSDLKESGAVLERILRQPGLDETVKTRIRQALEHLRT